MRATQILRVSQRDSSRSLFRPVPPFPDPLVVPPPLGAEEPSRPAGRESLHSTSERSQGRRGESAKKM